MKEGIFVGPQITLFEKQDFGTKLNFYRNKSLGGNEKVCRNCIGNEERKITVKLYSS